MFCLLEASTTLFYFCHFRKLRKGRQTPLSRIKLSDFSTVVWDTVARNLIEVHDSRYYSCRLV